MRNAALAALLLATAACATRPAEPPATAAAPVSEGYDLAAQRAKIARIPMSPSTAFLDAEEREVVNLLIQAAELMTPIYLRQRSVDNPTVRAEIARSQHPRKAALLDMFDLHFGPWDTLAENHPFYGGEKMPAGAGFYPTDLTKADFDAYLSANPGQKEALTSGYTVVKRQGDRLVAVPYSVEYRQWLEPAAKLLERAAARTRNASLRKFLNLRAKAFRTNDYYESELAWMDVSGTPIEVVIGPYEVYTDTLYGTKTAFEAFVTVQDPRESSALTKYKALLPDMERNLPVEESYKNFNRPFASPILVADQVHGGGDNVPGVQTIAFNLPNDERVREAKGAKKVILANVLGAKYDRILAPMAGLVLVPDQARLVTRKYMTNETLFHELAHSLGPGTISVGGRQTTVNAELKDVYSASEEAKADVMGLHNILYMMKRGELPAAEREQALATYFVGIFRAVRFGIDEAHGRGAAMQYSYLKEKGAFGWDERADRFRVDYDRMEAGLRDLLAELIRLQGNGDYAGTKAFFERHARLDERARAVLAKTAHIPTDIQPVYPMKV
ncbi:MAG: dipeptidyl-peptidase 3 family protein [Allosphingosinicella sp.]